MGDNGQVTFNINKFNKAEYTRRTEIVEAPELNEFMGVEKGQTVIFKVQAGTLDDVLRSKSLVDDETAALAMRILSMADAKDPDKAEKVMADLESATGLSDKTKFELELVQHCVVDPKLTLGDVRWISENFPFLITKLSTTIMRLTMQGSVRTPKLL